MGVHPLDNAQIERKTPVAYAWELARYITDASSIRAACINEFGSAPVLQDIKGFIDQRQKPKTHSHEARDNRTIGYTPSRDTGEPQPIGLRDMRRLEKDPVSMEQWVAPASYSATAVDLVKSVAKSFGLSHAQITGPRRFPYFVDARAVVAKLLSERGNSLGQIGRWIGGRDHSTISSLLQNFDIYSKRNVLVLPVYRANGGVDL